LSRPRISDAVGRKLGHNQNLGGVVSWSNDARSDFSSDTIATPFST